MGSFHGERRVLGRGMSRWNRQIGTTRRGVEREEGRCLVSPTRRDGTRREGSRTLQQSERLLMSNLALGERQYIANLCKRALRCIGASQGLLRDTPRLWRSSCPMYAQDVSSTVLASKENWTYATDLDMIVSLHAPSGPVRAMSCVRRPAVALEYRPTFRIHSD